MKYGLRAVSIMAVAVLLSSTAVVCVQSCSSDASDDTWYEAEVTPFTFPESGGAPILKALSQAEKTIDVGVYLLTSYDVLALLLEKQSQGVKVRILIEGNPANTDIEEKSIADYKSTRIFNNLVEKGADVRVINYVGCASQTYMFYHSKFAVIDEQKVAITSENWTVGNFTVDGGNRGWGVLIDSAAFASYIDKQIFEPDFNSTAGDVKSFKEVFPDLPPYTDSLYYSIGDYSTTSYKVKVLPVTSPDNSFASIKTMMNGATKRLYAEETDLSADYNRKTHEDNPYWWMIDKSEENVDVRYITYTGGDPTEEQTQVKIEAVSTLNNDTKVIAAGYSSTETYMHNKGIIADDYTFVGSVNWTPTSMLLNRELGVIIDSKDVSDYYAEAFLWDLYSYYKQGGDKEVCKVTYDVDGVQKTFTYIKDDYILLPHNPTKSSQSVYTYTFSHWDGYTSGMKAEKDCTLTAVFDQHTALGDNIWYAGLIAVLGVLAALSLCWWYFRHGRC